MTATAKQNRTSSAIQPIYHVPMRPHLLAFLREREHLANSEPLPLLRESPTAMFLHSLLLHKAALRDDQRHELPEQYSCRLPFTAPADNTGRLKIFLTPTRIIRFNSFVDQMMKTSLFELVDVFTDEGVKEKEVIYLFINRYRLYDVNFDSLKKACTRRRERLGMAPLKARKTHFFQDFECASGDICASDYSGL